MAECSHDCNSCGEKCEKRDFHVSLRAGSSVKKVIGIVSGKGGVGKSLVTSLLAARVNKDGFRSAILDADITGPSIPRSFGITTKAKGNEYGIFPEQTKTGIVITDKILKEIGISSPGKRAKILIHLEEEAHLFDFQIEKDKVYNINERNENCLFKLLSSINLEKYFNNFKINDYNSPELLYVQMKSRQPLNDDILRSEIGIEKLGYRMRIINKLKSESINYIQRLHNGNIRNGKSNLIYLEKKNNNNNNEFCNMCCIF